MKRLAVYALIFISFSLGAEETVLDTGDVIDLVNTNNGAVRIAASGEELGRSLYEQILGSGKPKVSFTTDSFSAPLYGYRNGSLAGYGIPLASESHTLSAGVTVGGMLSSGGTAGVSLDNALVYSRNEGTDSWTIEMDPEIGVTVFQPLFVNGRFLDFSILEQTRRTGEAGWEISRVRNLNTRNQILTGTLAAIHRVNVLRKTVGLLEKRVELAGLRLEMAAEDRRRGRISESDLLEIELDMGRQREILFDAGYQLVLAEMNVAGLLGLDDTSGYTFAIDYRPVDALMGKSEDFFHDISGNAGLLEAVLEVEQKDIALFLGGLESAPVLSFGFQAGPRYPVSRNSDGDLTASLTDLFSENAGMDVSLALAVTFDAWDGGVSKSRRKADEAALAIARESQYEAERAVLEERKVLLAGFRLLNERISLLESNIEYEERLLQRETDRLAAGASTVVDVETVLLSLASRRADVENLKGERFLLILQLVSLAGISVEDFLLQ